MMQKKNPDPQIEEVWATSRILNSLPVVTLQESEQIRNPTPNNLEVGKKSSPKKMVPWSLVSKDMSDT